MNDEDRELLRRLEAVTAPIHDATSHDMPNYDVPDNLDPEAASLREGWLAFGKLLDDRVFDNDISRKAHSRRWGTPKYYKRAGRQSPTRFPQPRRNISGAT